MLGDEQIEEQVADFDPEPNVQHQQQAQAQLQPPSDEDTHQERLFIKLPNRRTTSPTMNGMPTRRSTRSQSNINAASGSEYVASSTGSKSSASSQSPQGKPGRPTRSRRLPAEYEEEEEFSQPPSQVVTYTSRSGRQTQIKIGYAETDEEEEEDEAPVRRPGARRLATRTTQDMDGFISQDEDFEDIPEGRYSLRRRPQPAAPPRTSSRTNGRSSRSQQRQQRQLRRSARQRHEDDEYAENPDDQFSDPDGEGSLDADAVPTSPSLPSPHRPTPPSAAPSPMQNGRGYSLRERKERPNYAIPPPLDPHDITAGLNVGNGNGKNGKGRARPPRRPIFGAFGATLGGRGPGHLLGSNFGSDISRIPPPPPDSDSDDNPLAPANKALPGAGADAAGGAFTGSGLTGGDLTAAGGGPSNLGKIGTDTALADVDPLGVNTKVTFDEVGGLDDHISQLKEMITLPLLYPEVFKQFNITPPRGVLFHGPPGTGKTLVARALAASARSEGKGISFFMRKGADCLSKWVGEAERQLRLLFEEARNCQPSIIFFDEIDGLAPVRSSKQDQIHASIVSTMLALMDGMDGRGQVIIIGATNRPDAIDPALRRPGRFDREFYFPLPGLSARQRILTILTKGWEDWEGEKGEPMRKQLAEATKGYGGADLRALCTEAALNAIQRRYPQIYKSNDRLLLQPESIKVQPRDFMISVKKLIPSSARSTASAAVPLPTQLVPLLGDTLNKMREVLDHVLPVSKPRNVLEEAEWEDDGGEDGGFEQEMMIQAMETLRLHRPRVILHGNVGMGQSYVGAAALHHLEGYNVQSLDLATLMSDSTRTPEAAIIQLFLEAKRHKPSVIYIPSLIGWCAAISETARTTVRAMLDSLAPTDAVLLLAVVDGRFKELPADVREWFGRSRENRVLLASPTPEQRLTFFEELLRTAIKPPTQFPDGTKRKKRVLEELPIAPPLPPRQPTVAEIAAQQENDARVKAMLTHRLGPVLSDLKKKFKRFTKPAFEEYDLDPETHLPNAPPVPPARSPRPPDSATDAIIIDAPTNGEAAPLQLNGTVPELERQPSQQPADPSTQLPLPPPAPTGPKFHDMDLERMHAKLYYEGYLTPQEFLGDLSRIVANTELDPSDNERLFRAQAMYHAANATILSWEIQFTVDCERMATREKQRRREKRKEEKEKEKERGGSSNGSQYAPGTRRSGRNNGQEPELAITDPVALERKLKRQRSQGEGSQGSGEEDGTRTPKRQRTAELHDVSMEGVSSTEPTAAEAGTAASASEATTPLPAAPSSEISIFPEGMAPMAAFGANHGPIFPSVATSSGLPSSLANILDPMPAPSAPLVVVSPPDVPMEHLPEALTIQPQTENETSSTEHQVEMIARTPSPPPPEFRFDEALLSHLRSELVERTGDLSIEQLENLRASCLDCVWRHRTDWDRDQLLRELLGKLQRFIQEISSDDEDD